MTFIEFAEKVLGIELLDWQKVVLEAAQKCKDEGKEFYIYTYAQQGKTLLNNCIQQKLGYDRGFEDGRKLPHTYENCHNFTCRSHEQDNGYENAVEDLESLLRCRNYPGCAAGKGCDGVCSIHSDICKKCENFGIPYSLLEQMLKGEEK